MRLFKGIHYFLAGVKLAVSKDLARFIVAPALTSLVIVSAGLFFSLSYMSAYTERLVETLPSWLGFLSSVLIPVLYVIGSLAGVWLFGLFAAIIGSVFLGDLALQVDSRSTPKNEPSPSWARQALESLAREATKLRYHLPRLLGLLLLGFIPILNTFAPLLWLLFGAWLMAAQFCDYCCEHRGLSFPDTLVTLRRNRLAALGFGACVTVGMAIPILNFLVAPVAVIGGTRLMSEYLDA